MVNADGKFGLNVCRYTDRVLHERGWVGVAPIEHVEKKYIYIYYIERDRPRHQDREKTVLSRVIKIWMSASRPQALRFVSLTV